jgi:ribose transport system ATP-binding protein
LEEPTAGVDVGSKAEIYRLLEGAAGTGKSILLISSDFEEVIRICDRALIFNKGTVCAEIQYNQFDLATFTSLAGGELPRHEV